MAGKTVTIFPLGSFLGLCAAYGSALGVSVSLLNNIVEELIVGKQRIVSPVKGHVGTLNTSENNWI